MRTITAKKKTNGTDSLNYNRYICNKTTDAALNQIAFVTL